MTADLDRLAAAEAEVALRRAVGELVALGYSGDEVTAVFDNALEEAAP